MNSVAEVLESALALSQEQRAALVVRILQSLESEDDSAAESLEAYEDELADVVSSRLHAIRSGSAQLVDGRSAIDGIRRRLGG